MQALLSFAVPIIGLALLFVVMIAYDWLRAEYWHRRVPDYRRDLSDRDMNWLKRANLALLTAREDRPGCTTWLNALGVGALVLCGLGVAASFMTLPEIEAMTVVRSLGEERILALDSHDISLALAGSGMSVAVGLWAYYVVAHRVPRTRDALLHKDEPLRYEGPVTFDEDSASEEWVPDEIWPVVDPRAADVAHDVRRHEAETHTPFDPDAFLASVSRAHTRRAHALLGIAIVAAALFLSQFMGRHTTVYADRVEVAASMFAPPEVVPLAGIDEVRLTCAMCDCAPVPRYRLRKGGEELISIRIRASNLERLDALDRDLRRAGVPRRRGASFDPDCESAAREELGAGLDTLFSTDL